MLAGGQSLVPMLALRLTRFEHLVDVNRVAELSGVARENGTLVVQAATRQRVMERDAAGRRGGAAARRGDAADRALPDPQPRHGRRFARPRRSRVGVPGGRGRARCRARAGRPRRRPPPRPGRRLLRRHVDDRGRDRRVARRRPFPRVAHARVGSRSRSWRAATATSRSRAWRARSPPTVRASRCSGSVPPRSGPEPRRTRCSRARRPPTSPKPRSRDLDPPADVHASSSTRRRIARHLVERAVTRAREGSACCRLRCP